MIKVITIDREYGCGAPVIAQKLATRLGWRLWDRNFTEEIARRANCEPAAVAQREEQRDPLYYRLFKSFLRGSYEANLQIHRLGLLDADCILAFSEELVRQVASAGECVIVGRGAQYFLHDRIDTYHVFLYAPYEEKIRREQNSGRSIAEASQLVETVDTERTAFIKKYFAKDWPNPQLYHLMVNTKIGDEAVVTTILGGMAVLEKRTKQ